MSVEYLVGDVLDVVAGLPDASVDLVATSPPFWQLRDYGLGPAEWGQEPTPAQFLDHLFDLVDALAPKLAAHGTLAVELGDTYSGSGGAGGDYHSDGLRAGQRPFTGSGRTRPDGHGVLFRGGRRLSDKRGPGVPAPKSLCGIPTLFGDSLVWGRNLLRPERVFEPWLLRNRIVWARNNPPRGRLADKVQPATSYLTIATRSPDRWFDLDAVRRPNPRAGETQAQHRRQPCRGGQRETNDLIRQNPAGAPPLDHWWDPVDGDLAWLVNTQGSNLAHYAMWPPKLAQRLVLAMCPPQVCRTCGQPRRRLVEVAPSPITPAQRDNKRSRRLLAPGPTGNRHNETRQAATTGWSDCGHDNWRPGLVLDCFAGTGTTLAAAEVHGRDAVGIDLDPDNPALYPTRRRQVRRALLGTVPEVDGQLQLDLTDDHTPDLTRQPASQFVDHEEAP